MSGRPRWGRGYAMVPGWLLLKGPTPNALTVYVHLAMHGTFSPGEGTYEQCRPSKRTLASGDPKRGYPGCGLGEQVIGRALRELEALGAIKGEKFFDPAKNGAQGATVYRLIFGEITEEQDDATGAETPAQGGVSPATPPSVATSPRIKSDTPPRDQTDTPPRGITGNTQPRTPNQEPKTQNPPSRFGLKSRRARRRAATGGNRTSNQPATRPGCPAGG